MFIPQFRRAAMAISSRSWEALEASWPHLPQVQRFHKELWALCCVAPLLQADLHSGYDGVVTCSYASESGGASAVATQLMWPGRSLKTFWSDRQLAPVSLPLLQISVFNGIRGSLKIYDIFGLAPQRQISIDVSRPGIRVTRTTWPDTMELHDIRAITKHDVKEWANRYHRIQEVHLWRNSHAWACHQCARDPKIKIWMERGPTFFGRCSLCCPGSMKSLGRFARVSAASKM